MTERSYTPANFEEIEKDAMRGDVNIESADFANNCLSFVSEAGVTAPASLVSHPQTTSALFLSSQNVSLQAEVSFAGSPVQPLSSQVAPVQAAEAARLAADAEAARLRFIHQKKFLSFISTCFRVIDPKRNGDCMFECIALSFSRNRLTLKTNGEEYTPGIPITAKIVRNLLADELVRLKGVVPGMLYSPFESEDGQSCDVERRNGDPRMFTLTTYADALRTTIYGGDIEIALIAWLFKLKIFLFSAWQWRGHQRELSPSIHVAPECEDPEGGKICLLWIEGESPFSSSCGGLDHYQLLIPTRDSQDEFKLSSSDDEDEPGSLSTPPKYMTFPYPQAHGKLSHSDMPDLIDCKDEDGEEPEIMTRLSKHAMMMGNGLPKWNVDLEVCIISPEVGRGIVALRTFEADDVAGIYDGHRCDVDGNSIIERDSLRLFFQAHPQLDRRITGDKFKVSHSVSCGRNKNAGLVIDGHPLCHPMLDANIDSLGRFALANSASSDVTGVV
jgi:hypothetical protein